MHVSEVRTPRTSVPGPGVADAYKEGSIIASPAGRLRVYPNFMSVVADSDWAHELSICGLRHNSPLWLSLIQSTWLD